jgi:hypothetical protein
VPEHPKTYKFKQDATKEGRKTAKVGPIQAENHRCDGKPAKRNDLKKKKKKKKKND